MKSWSVKLNATTQKFLQDRFLDFKSDLNQRPSDFKSTLDLELLFRASAPTK